MRVKKQVVNACATQQTFLLDPTLPVMKSQLSITLLVMPRLCLPFHPFPSESIRNKLHHAQHQRKGFRTRRTSFNSL